MGTPSYVINWNELIDELQRKIQINLDGDFNFNIKPIEDVLKQYFPDILELLKALVEQTKKTGQQHITGQHQKMISAGNYAFTLIPESDILLTGLTYGQSVYNCEDYYDLVIRGADGAEIKLFEQVSVKDTVQQKLLARFFPVPAGYEVTVILHAVSGGKTGWVDFEYLDLQVPEETGTIIIRYLTQGHDDIEVLAEERRILPLGVQSVANVKTFEGLTPKMPVVKVVFLSSKELTKVVEFWFVPDNGIGHDYDLKVTLRWEDNSTCDLDLHAYLDHNKASGVWYGCKTYESSEHDKLWLDYDYQYHGADGYEADPEIITVLGCKNQVLSIAVDNYNKGSLREDPLVEISTAEGEVLKQMTIPRRLLNLGETSTGKVWLCDIDLSTGDITKMMQAVEEMGVF